MLQKPFPSGGLALRSRRSNRRKHVLAATAIAAILGPATLAGLSIRSDTPLVAPQSGTFGRAPVQEAAVTASPGDHARTFDPTPSLKLESLSFARNVPLEAAFRSPAVQPDAMPEPLLPSAQKERARPLQSSPALETTQSIQIVPLPVPRPSELRAPRASAVRQMASGPVFQRTKSAALPTAPADNRSFFEKLFGVQPASGPSLSYAALESDAVSVAPSSRLSPTLDPAAGAATAVYDISARVVYMPNGERLEAHSGLGDRIDDPRYVHVRMRGATPPGTYDLTEREQLFHGVRALRLNPVGGSAAIYGRAGLLAHTYMLGPNGDSNGCVSIKSYDKFLHAFLRGEVKRLVVVAGRGQDVLPSIGNNRIGMRQRSALRARDT